MPRNERTEVRFALSYDALKMNGTLSSPQISAIRRAIRQTNFSDSITHGPRMNAGDFPPIADVPDFQRFSLQFAVRSYGRFVRPLLSCRAKSRHL